MNRILLCFVLAVVWQQTALAQSATLDYGWLSNGSASLELRYRAFTTERVNPLIDKRFVGEAIYTGDLYLYRAPNWDVGLVLKLQTIIGGIHNRSIKVPAVNYTIDLRFRQRLSESGLWLAAAAFHQSTHRFDPVIIENPEDAASFQAIAFNVEDVNLLRLGLEFEYPTLWLSTGLQPVRMNYFLITEANLMFNKSSYSAPDKRFYLNALYPLLTTASDRLALLLESEFLNDTRYTL